VSVVSAEGDANVVSIVIARHTPAPPTDLLEGSVIKWTSPLTTIETLSFNVQDLELVWPSFALVLLFAFVSLCPLASFAFSSLSVVASAWRRASIHIEL